MIKEFFKKITLRKLIILILLLMFNSYAWFIYATKVYNSITTRIVAWDVTFKAGEEEIVTTLLIDVERIYPGMEEFTQIVEAKNLGEMDAVLTYAIREMTILGTTYTAGEEYEVGLFYTPEQLYEILTSADYPFVFEIRVENDGEMLKEGGQCTLTISVTWEFELNDMEFNQIEIDTQNELDTQYGEMAYEYHKEHPELPSIQLTIDIIASQVVV